MTGPARGEIDLWGGAPIVVGWIGSMPRRALGEGFEVVVLPPSDVSAVRAARVDVWVVEGALAIDRLKDALFAHGAPVVVRVSARAMAPWRGLLADGLVDVVASGMPVDELEARVAGAAVRARRFNLLAGRLATTAAHDLRGPLQGVRLILLTLEREGVFAGELSEDLDMLLASSETLEVLLHGLYNLGRRPTDGRRAQDEPDVCDLAQVMMEEAARRPIRDRVQVFAEGPMPVRVPPSELRLAVLDLLRVAALLAPRGRVSTATAKVVGDVATVELEMAVWPVVVPYAEALLVREAPLVLRDVVRLPFAGLHFAREVLRVHAGDLSVRGIPEREAVRVELRAPRA